MPAGTLPGVTTTPDLHRPSGLLGRLVGPIPPSLFAVLVGTFTLRFSTGLTGAMIVYYLANLPRHGGPTVEPVVIGMFAASFFAAELIMSTPFGLLADRLGHRLIMQLGPIFGLVAVVITYFTSNLVVIGATRVLEGLSAAASVPAILGFIAAITAGDELLRGRAAARFEGATLAGLGFGLVAAGPVYNAIGRTGFLLNAVFYGISFLIYRYGVPREPVQPRVLGATHPGRARYVAILRSPSVWLLAPTWIAINAALGLWTSQSIFQLVRAPEPRFAGQWLMGHFGSLAISAGLAVGLIVFFIGLAFWGERFRTYRRTTIIFYGILGGAAVVLAGAAVNHSGGLPHLARLVEGAVVIGGLFVLAGATPAALGMLADVSEAFPADRGAIMGLYSVFLAVGQIVGSLIGGVAGQVRGIDGILVATLLLLGIALVPLRRLRDAEHLLAGDSAAGSTSP